ncbi:MAG TPA: NAD(P)/FAD-dependent oxidoreductase [Jatrophihabitans sp.]
MTISVLPAEVDAVVIGGGPNGLVSAALLADSGWSVLLLEAQQELGGAVKSIHAVGWTMDRFSSSYPLAVASPVLRGLDLESCGLRWARSDVSVAHPLGPDDPDGAMIHREPATTAAHLAEESAADGEVWLELCAQYARISERFLEAMLTAWPPLNAARKLTAQLGGTAELMRFARFLALPTHRMGIELFAGRRGRALLAGNAMHADAPPDAPVSGLMGWLMAMLAQDVGFPVPIGGAAMLTAALAARARSSGADLRVDEPVAAIGLSGGTARTVMTSSGQTVRASKAIVADVSAAALYQELLSSAQLPAGLRADLHNLEWDYPTVKVNYRLAEHPRWTARHANGAGVVHAGADSDEIVHWSADLGTGRIPERPFALIGQTSSVDATRSPPGTEAMWAYSHLPRGVHDDASAHLLAERMGDMIAAHAPGFDSLILDRDVQTPSSLSAENANLVNGAVNGGTSQLFQQLVFRPVPGSGGARTVFENLYLGSAAIHPGGGVHGACGALAAKAALSDHGHLGAARRRAASGFFDRLYRARPSAR